MGVESCPISLSSPFPTCEKKGEKSSVENVMVKSLMMMMIFISYSPYAGSMGVERNHVVPYHKIARDRKEEKWSGICWPCTRRVTTSDDEYSKSLFWRDVCLLNNIFRVHSSLLPLRSLRVKYIGGLGSWKRILYHHTHRARMNPRDRSCPFCQWHPFWIIIIVYSR